MCNPTVRLPLVEILEETKRKVTEALRVSIIDFNEHRNQFLV
jgi:hypothetical protein